MRLTSVRLKSVPSLYVQEFAMTTPVGLKGARLPFPLPIDVKWTKVQKVVIFVSRYVVSKCRILFLGIHTCLTVPAIIALRNTVGPAL